MTTSALTMKVNERFFDFRRCNQYWQMLTAILSSLTNASLLLATTLLTFPLVQLLTKAPLTVCLPLSIVSWCRAIAL